MFDKEIYRQRRSVLCSKVISGIIVLLGNDEVGMNYRGNTYKFRQDSSFLYYTGIDLPGLAVVIDVEEGRQILYGNELTADDIVWTGLLESLTVLAYKTAISEVKPYNQIESFLKDAQNRARVIHFLPPYRGEHVLKLQQWLHLSFAQLGDNVSEVLIKAIVSMRSYKRPEEIAEMEKAVNISTQMHELFFKSVKPEKTEMNIAAMIHGHALSSGGDLAYPIILTVNGETLHIHARDTKMKNGQLVLCDAGAETNMHYAGDISRTAPVNGMFSALQKDMYNMILHIQSETIAACKPGALFRDVHALAAKMLLEGVRSLGIVRGNIMDAFAEDVHTLFFPCGLGHMIGLDVHDMENLGEQYVGYTESVKKSTSFGWKSLRLAKELEPGFTLTIEPGIYFIPTLIDTCREQRKFADFINYKELEKFKNFGGIRIEDNILVTDHLPHILGHKIAPKTVGEIELFME